MHKPFDELKNLVMQRQRELERARSRLDRARHERCNVDEENRLSREAQQAWRAFAAVKAAVMRGQTSR